MTSGSNDGTPPERDEGVDREQRLVVLLADDDRDLREALAETMRDGGLDVLAVARGTQLLELMLSSRTASPPQVIDVVVCDLWMPGMTGLGVLESLRRMGTTTPFILITGLCDDELRSEAERLGATAVLEKALAFSELVSLCRQQAQHRRLAAASGA